jgi:hypothetical protein
VGVHNGGGGTLIIFVAIIDVVIIIIGSSIEVAQLPVLLLIPCECWIFNRSGYLAVVELFLVVNFGCRGRI